MRPSRKSMQSSVSQMWLSHHMCENQLRRLWKCTISGHPRLTEAKLCERDSLYLWHYEKDTLHESNTPGIWDPLMLVHPLEHACLGNPRDGGAWWAAIYGVAESWTPLKRLTSSRSRSSCWFRRSRERENPLEKGMERESRTSRMCVCVCVCVCTHARVGR